MRRHSDTLQPGAAAPDFTLADASGATHSLRGLLTSAAATSPGSLLLVFDRGTW